MEIAPAKVLQGAVRLQRVRIVTDARYPGPRSLSLRRRVGAHLGNSRHLQNENRRIALSPSFAVKCLRGVAPDNACAVF